MQSPHLSTLGHALRLYGHDTGWRSLPSLLVQEVRSGTYECDYEPGQRIRLEGPAAWWVIPPGCRHRNRVPRGGGEVDTRFCHLDYRLPDGRLLTEAYEIPLRPERAHAQRLSDLFDGLEALGETTTVADAIRREAKVLELVATLIDMGRERRPPHPRWHDFQPLVQEVRAHLGQPWDRTMMAQAVHLSPTRFHALFREVMGEPPLSWLRRQRMEAAKQLLLTTSHRVFEIAEAVGYPDPYHFSRAFQQNEGVSPKQWRDKRSGA